MMRKVELWTIDAIDELKGALESTDWNVFNSSSMDERTDTVISYVNYLKDSIIPTWEIEVFPNNPPWMNRRVKEALQRQKEAHLHGDAKEKWEAKREAKVVIRKAKLEYKGKIEEKFHANDLKQYGMA